MLPLPPSNAECAGGALGDTSAAGVNDQSGVPVYEQFPMVTQMPAHVTGPAEDASCQHWLGSSRDDMTAAGPPTSGSVQDDKGDPHGHVENAGSEVLLLEASVCALTVATKQRVKKATSISARGAGQRGWTGKVFSRTVPR